MRERLRIGRFERGRLIRLWQPRRYGERNQALDTTVYSMAGLARCHQHGAANISIPDILQM
jgi:phage terminase large subunit GpA-like protein